jgi:hypothetical protein
MSEANESMQKFKEAIAQGGAEREKAFQLLENHFGAQLRAGGRSAIIIFQHLSHLVAEAGSPDAGADFHLRFFTLLPRITQNDFRFSGFSENVKQEVENLDKTPSLFSRIVLGRR